VLTSLCPVRHEHCQAG